MKLVAMDPTVQVAALGIVTTLISSATIVIVAKVTNRKERETAADEGVEATLRERVAFNEAEIAALRDNRDRKEAVIVRLRDENEELEDENRELRSENENLRAEITALRAGRSQ